MGDKAVVRAGYEAIADAYTRERREDSEDIRLVEDFAARLAPRNRVLDAGCGGGRPVAVALSGRFDLVGLDLARAQLRLYRRHAPRAKVAQGDMTRLPFRDGAFHGLLSLYAIIHVPRDEHRDLVREFHRVLRPSGIALLCMGEIDLPGDVAEYMGARMFWSHYDGETNRRMLVENGFEILGSRVVVDFQDPSAVHRFLTVRRA